MTVREFENELIRFAEKSNLKIFINRTAWDTMKIKFYDDTSFPYCCHREYFIDVYHTNLITKLREIIGDLARCGFPTAYVPSKPIVPINNHLTPEIKNVIFNRPATIVFWTDGTKTVVKAVNEPFDEEKGLVMAIAKKAFGNRSSYYDEIRKWLPTINATPVKEEEEEKHCWTCAHGNRFPFLHPCVDCDRKLNHWEPINK